MIYMNLTKINVVFMLVKIKRYTVCVCVYLCVCVRVCVRVLVY